MTCTGVRRTRGLHGSTCTHIPENRLGTHVGLDPELEITDCYRSRVCVILTDLYGRASAGPNATRGREKEERERESE